MAVALDAVGTALVDDTGATTYSFAGITVGAGASRGLLIQIIAFGAAVPTVTWDFGGSAQAPTLIQNYQTINAGFAATHMYLYGLLAPTSGNKTLRVVFGSATSGTVIQATSFTNVLQTSVALAFPNVTNSTSAGTSGSLPITTASTGYTVCTAVDGGTGSRLFTGPAGVNSSFDDSAGFSAVVKSAGAYVQSPGGTDTYSFAMSGGSNVDLQGCSVAQAVAAAAFLPSLPRVSTWAGWEPPATAAQQNIALDPPRSAPQNPPLGGGPVVPATVKQFTSWPDWLAQKSILLDPPFSPPQNPPFVGGAAVPESVTLAWYPPPWPAQVGAQLFRQAVINNPPFNGGAKIPFTLQDWWPLLDWMPATLQLLHPPQAGPIASAPIYNTPTPGVQEWWWKLDWPAVSPGKFLFRPVDTIPALLYLEADLPFWFAVDWPIARNRPLTPPSVGQNPPFAGMSLPADWQSSWYAVDWPAVQLRGPLTDNPPAFLRRTQVNQLAWWPPDYPPVVQRKLSPPIGAAVPDNPFFRGARVPPGVLAFWLPPDWPPAQKPYFPPVPPQIIVPPFNPLVPPPQGGTGHPSSTRDERARRVLGRNAYLAQIDRREMLELMRGLSPEERKRLEQDINDADVAFLLANMDNLFG